MTEANPARYLARLTSPDVAELDKDEGVVILPIGAVEQHGPHLPLLTDTLIVTHVLDATLAQLPVDVRAWALPPLSYGKSTEHLAFPGTVSLSAATLLAVLHDIAASLQQAGFRRLAFLNGHGGNMALVDVAARDIRAATGLMCFCIHPGAFTDAPFEITPQEMRWGIHAGELETSLVLAMAPESVKMDRAPTHFPEYPETGAPLFLFGSASTAWLAHDWSPSGVFGDATLGAAEKGRALIEQAVAHLTNLIAAISRFEVPADRQ
jgi:creatinine amidohydrolase/Fe(II)-dependent formamide hydrolase-like protein